MRPPPLARGRGSIDVEHPMAHYKGRKSPKATEREFAHVVEIAVPQGGLGAQLDAMHYFHEARGIKACLGRGRREENLSFLRWYFTSPTIAEAFATEFDGTCFTPAGK